MNTLFVIEKMEAIDTAEILFDPPVSVCAGKSFILMNVTKIGVDGNGRLWYFKKGGTGWQEINDNLIYSTYINDALVSRLNLICAAKKISEK
jgi:hypothetical protein